MNTERHHALTFDLLRGFDVEEVTQVDLGVDVVWDFALVK